jgi:hypothetical protein
METKNKVDFIAFLMTFAGFGLLTYSLGYIASLGLLLLFWSDNIYACRRLERNGLNDWWRNEI